MCSLNVGDDASVQLDMHQILNETNNNNESEYLQPLMNEEEEELEDKVPALQDRVTGVVTYYLWMND